jgi:hypothetical protein
MAFDGAGVFLRVKNWIADATAGVKIRADFHDLEDDNFAEGLSHCITKDGQSTITQNIPWNSKRITALEDPVDAQDAATKAYADTKIAIDGGTAGSTFTSDVVIKNDDPILTLNGKEGFKNSIYGQKGDKNRWEIVLGNATAESGGNAGSDFQLINYADDGTLLGDVLFGSRATGLLTVKGDPEVALGIATKQYADTKLALAGGAIYGTLTIGGFLQVYSTTSLGADLTTQGVTTCVGELVAVRSYVRFNSLTSNGYIQWMNQGTYYLGGGASGPGGIIWHSGNHNATALIARIEALEARLAITPPAAPPAPPPPPLDE